MGLHHEEPIGAEVMGFHDNMVRCSALDFARKWFCHTQPYTIQLTCAQIQVYFDQDGDPEVDHMVPMWRMVRKEEVKLFAGLPEIPDFRLGVELMESGRSSDLDFDYISTMITEEHTGVRIEAAKKAMIVLKHRDSWAVYVVDLDKKLCLVITEETSLL